MESYRGLSHWRCSGRLGGALRLNSGLNAFVSKESIDIKGIGHRVYRHSTDGLELIMVDEFDESDEFDSSSWSRDQGGKKSSGWQGKDAKQIEAEALLKAADCLKKKFILQISGWFIATPQSRHNENGGVLGRFRKPYIEGHVCWEKLCHMIALTVLFEVLLTV